MRIRPFMIPILRVGGVVVVAVVGIRRVVVAVIRIRRVVVTVVGIRRVVVTVSGIFWFLGLDALVVDEFFSRFAFNGEALCILACDNGSALDDTGRVVCGAMLNGILFASLLVNVISRYALRDDALILFTCAFEPSLDGRAVDGIGTAF